MIRQDGTATAAEPVTGPAGLDAGLFALIDEAREAGARVEAAIRAVEEAEERTEKVLWPQALIVTEDDTRLWKLKAGDPFDVAHLIQMREGQAHRDLHLIRGLSSPPTRPGLQG